MAFELRRGALAVQLNTLTSPVTIGRSHCAYNQPYVSKKHCLLTVTSSNNTVEIHHISAKNKTWVKTTPTQNKWKYISLNQACTLHHGAQIALDQTCAEGTVFTLCQVQGKKHESNESCSVKRDGRTNVGGESDAYSLSNGAGDFCGKQDDSSSIVERQDMISVVDLSEERDDSNSVVDLCGGSENAVTKRTRIDGPHPTNITHTTHPRQGVHLGDRKCTYGDLQASSTTRAALLGGYLKGPRLLILCGPQGAGKSYFSNALKVAGKDDAAGSETKRDWTIVCQDTANGGRPGPRTKCERMVRAALKSGKCVVVDRMHLSLEQRAHFLFIGHEMKIPTDAVILLPPIAEVQRRVRSRESHPGNVMGEAGARMATNSYAKLVVPTYDEGFQLITKVETSQQSLDLARLYASTR